MKISILQLIDGAKAARGLTVIIDVFRAFTLEACMFAKGADKVIPIGEVDEAQKIKSENPSMILAGERHGAILPGFDIGNAPSAIADLDLSGKTVIHTTSAGTQGVYNATEAGEILVASLVNAKATADYIRKSGAETVSLVCMGWEGETETDEDTLCAMYIRDILEGKKRDIIKEAKNLKYTSGAKFFDPAQSAVFPTADFDICTDVDRFDFAMRLVRGPFGCGYITPVILG